MKKIIDEKMNSKHYWDYMYEANGIFGNGYSQWSTFRRLGEIYKSRINEYMKDQKINLIEELLIKFLNERNLNSY